NITSYSPQLCNTLMEINDGGTMKSFSFRAPSRLAAIPLDLNKASRHFSLELDPVPNLETLALKLQSADCPEPKLTLPSQGDWVALNKPLLLTRDDPIGTQIELKLVSLKNNTAELQLAAYYKNADGRRTLLQGKDVTKAIAKQESDLQRAENEM